MSRSIADILDAAATLIEPEGAWVQHDYALNSDGGIAEAASDAVCYCVLGAISVAMGAGPTDEAGYEEQRFFRSITGSTIPEWNDAPERTQAEVVPKLREAAALAREQGL